MQLDWLPDPDTDAQLLHSAMRPRDNRRRLRHCKNAVIWAMGHLKPEHREQISLFYGARMSKSQIAARQNLSKSAVSKSIRHGEDKLRDYAALYMEVYDRLEQEFLLED
jgi:DNA-directed RNA polymerase specialized sigma24 family protein